jgi:hypothetical protein
LASPHERRSLSRSFSEKHGFDRFVATIATDNSIIRRLLDRFGRIVASETSFGVSELVFVRRHSWRNAVPRSGVGGDLPVAFASGSRDNGVNHECSFFDGYWREGTR